DAAWGARRRKARRESGTGRGAVSEPEHPKATAVDSRASPPRSAPEGPRSPGSQRRSKQVAASERQLAAWAAWAAEPRLVLRLTVAGMPYSRTSRLHASFEPHHGKEPTGRHVVN